MPEVTGSNPAVDESNTFVNLYLKVRPLDGSGDFYILSETQMLRNDYFHGFF